MFEQKDLDDLNENIAGWKERNDKDLMNEIDVLGIQHSKYSPNKVPLRRAVKSRLSQKFGLTNKISYSMPRSAVFLHKGVSRHHTKNNPRTAKEWYAPVIDRNIDELGDIVAEGQGTLVINALQIR